MTSSESALIFGGNGATARVLTPLLTKTHKVHSVIRNADQAPSLEELGAQTILQDLETASVEDLTTTIKDVNPDVIIWAAGAGYGNPTAPDKIDHQAAVRSFDAAAAAGVKRYISISALDVRDRENKPVPSWYSEQDVQGSERLWKVLEPYMRAKLAADADLVGENERRGLSWTILRPGRLVNEAATGKCEAGRVSFGKAISREDVAGVVVACVENERTAGLAFDIVGGETDVSEAVRKVADGRVDCFQGYF